jgi:hypothetical protein
VRTACSSTSYPSEVAMSTEPEPMISDEDEPPPVLGSWRNIYALLIGELLAITALLYALRLWLS